MLPEMTNKKYSVNGIFNLYIFSLVFLFFSNFLTVLTVKKEGRSYMISEGVIIYDSFPIGVIAMIIIYGILLIGMFVFSAYLAKLSHNENKSNIKRSLFIGFSGVVSISSSSLYILRFLDSYLGIGSLMYILAIFLSVLFLLFSIILGFYSESNKYYLYINFLTVILSIFILIFGF